MASFYAELQVAGNTYRVVHCHYACHQATDARGRVQAKVRYAPLKLVLDVPTDDGLLAWAHAPHKPLAGQVVFYDVARQTAHETIAFTAGECVQYAEDFASSATGDGAYVCQLTITAPSFELRAGGPVAAVASVAQQALPVAAIAQEAATVARQAAPVVNEAGDFSPLDPTTYFVRPDAPFDWELSQHLERTFPISLNAPYGFAEAVRADLQAIYNTPTGRRLIESIQASGKRIPITHHEFNAAFFPKLPDGPNGEPQADWEPAFHDESNTTPGPGIGMTIGYNPFNGKADDASREWHTRPPGIGLAHELIHAEQAAYGRMLWGDSPNPGGIDPRNPNKRPVVQSFELETVGVPPHDRYPISENKIRAEWNPPQTARLYY
jgi:hypothetical protein